MRKLKLYLDTSVINFLFADDAPEKKEATIDFFQTYIRNGTVDAYISPVVIDELTRTANDEKRERLIGCVKEYPLPILDIGDQPGIADLAESLILNGVIPPKKQEDAMHIAIAVIFEMDVLVSWNFKHLANINKERKVLIVSQAEGYYYPLRMTTPLEVMGT
ncbi:MAG: hypothetical protein K9M45_01940 [Kiritimatiellales bacterium]|nr:hypothetical protein [Kiritimatiellales bacterium]